MLGVCSDSMLRYATAELSGELGCCCVQPWLRSQQRCAGRAECSTKSLGVLHCALHIFTSLLHAD
jgi:hypothetical protein